MQKTFLRKSILVLGTMLIGALPIVLPLVGSTVFAQEQGTAPNDITQLNDEIRQRRERISSLDAEMQQYQDQITAKKDEVASISGQLSVIENQIAITNLSIQSNEEKIKTIGLEIEKTNVDIEEHQGEIDEQKGIMGDLLRQLHRHNDRTLLEVTLSYDRFSTYFSEVNNLTTIETRLKGEVDRVEILKHELEVRNEELRGKQHELELARADLETKRKDLSGQQTYQAVLLDQAAGEQSQIEGNLEELKREQQSITGEISSLEDAFRQKLEETNSFPVLGDAVLGWPVPPIRGISAFFHDPTYPYRRVFEHNAIDIPTPQGTPVVSAEDGIVAIARRRDWVTNSEGRIIRPAYNYVSIVHGEDISTVYGHLSAINVVEGSFVRKGTVIALSGGTPGTAGAGTFTTGPHLHFEVRVNGIPDDPLNYLPQI